MKKCPLLCWKDTVGGFLVAATHPVWAVGTSRRCLSPILRLSKPLFYVAVLFSLTSSESARNHYSSIRLFCCRCIFHSRQETKPSCTSNFCQQTQRPKLFFSLSFHRRRSGFKVQRVPEWYVTRARRRPDGIDLLCFSQLF
jgi:hypothetical protein